MSETTTQDGEPLIGLVIVAHGDLATALLNAAEHVVGPLSHAEAIAIGPNDDLRQCQARVNAMVATVDSGRGVVIVTDMFGGTPSNLSLGAIRDKNVDVIYGANLPMLIKLAKSRTLTMPEAVEAALEAGRKYVNSAGAILEPGATA